MSLAPGTRLGPYEVQHPLGAGGMGDVYAAVDRRIGRAVALKLVPASVADDPAQAARLKQEARVLASVNHPHIATLFGFEEHDGVCFLAMELVEGSTLAEWIARRGAPAVRAGSDAGVRVAAGRQRLLDDLALAEQVADALAAAHDQGIVHRDLKPGNVMIDAAGRVKVLDFGLARQLPSRAESEGDTRTSEQQLTGDDRFAGTVPYMSPEQIRGEPVDARTDLWAFGCVLYELLTGRRAFARDTTAETMAAILEVTPDVDTLPPGTPTRVRLLIERCLRRDRRQRLHHAADARIEVADAHAELSEPGSDSAATHPAARGWRPSSRTRGAWLALAGLLTLLALGVTSVLWRGGGGLPSVVSGEPVRFSVPLPPGVTIYPGEVHTYLAVSPDGDHLVFAGATARTPLHHHTFRTATTRVIPGTEGAASPVWSPDSRFVAFFAAGQLKKVDVFEGRPPQAITEANWEAGNAWSQAGLLLFAQPTRDGIAIHQVPAEGGAPTPVTHVDQSREIGHFWPYFLPDGRRFLYLALEKSSAEAPARQLYLASLDDGQARAVPGVASRAMFVPPGLLLYAADGVLIARPFDAERVAFTGEAVPISAQLRYFRMTGQAEFSVSLNPSRPLLAFHGGPWTSRLVVYDRAGVPRATLGEPAAFDQIRISPDGQQLAAAVLDPANGGRDLWVYELATSRARRLTLHPPDEQSPVWSPDGRRIAYRSDVNGPPDLYARDASGDGVPDRLLSTRTVSVPEDWMADGLLYQELSRATGFDQWLLPLPGGTPRPLLDTRFSETGGRVSPDGRLVAFESDESGAPQIYVAPVASPGARRAVSTTGGVAPRWRADGRELFFLAPGGAIMAVPMPADTRRPPGTPVALFTLSAAMHGRSYDVTPDGQRFVVNEVVAAIANSPISVILNWAADLRP